MARALAGNPTILLADEPTTSPPDAEKGRANMHIPTGLARTGAFPL